MSSAMERYRKLDNELVFIRWVHRGLESEDEESLLDAMEQVWWELDESERELLSAEPPRSLIRSEKSASPPRRIVDTDKEADPGAPPRRIVEAA